jgi:hypothetical protein
MFEHLVKSHGRPSTSTNAASACGSQKVIAMARYHSIAEGQKAKAIIGAYQAEGIIDYLYLCYVFPLFANGHPLGKRTNLRGKRAAALARPLTEPRVRRAWCHIANAP